MCLSDLTLIEWMILSILTLVFYIACIILGVAYLTLFERKVLSLPQYRVGPNKVSIKGLLQPVLDGIKLLGKEGVTTRIKEWVYFYIAPVGSLFLILCTWGVIPAIFFYLSWFYSVLFALVILGLGVYMIMVAGWSSKSKYRLIGSIRSIAITLRYEICMAIVFLSPVFLINNLSLNIFNHYYLNSTLYRQSLVIWIMCILAECNRAPFDIVEAESELVSGFNIEYRSSEFVLLFMREYSRLLILSSIASLLFIRVSYYGSIYIFSLITFYRSVYPRYRYDHLMQLTWLYLLPLSTIFLIFSSVCYYLHVYSGDMEYSYRGCMNDLMFWY